MNGKVRHGNNPIMNMCAANVVAIRDPAGNRKMDKSKSTGRIDGIVALAMALGRASSAEVVAPSIYEQRGVIVL
jgi:phage terminase large subunit-like protein